MPAPEKLSAQALRRVHEDHRLLMADYDEILSQLEHPEIAQTLISIIQGLDVSLTAIETAFMTHHSNLPPLEGARGISLAATQPPPQPIQEDMAGMRQDAEIGSTEELAAEDEEGNSNATTPADSGTEELPSGDEVVEGMETEAEGNPESDKPPMESEKKKEKKEKRLDPEHHKNLREKYGKCQACGKPDCKCTKCMKEPNVRQPGPCPGEGPNAGTAKKPQVAPQHQHELHTRQGKSMDGMELKSHERSVVKEAHGFLGELGELKEFGDEHRMKSYGFHKDTERIANFNMEENPQLKSLDDEEMHKAMHPHRKMCKNLSRFFKRLASEKAFGDAHREEARDYFEDMKDMVGDDAPTEDSGDSGDAPSEGVEPGEMGEKSLDDRALRLEGMLAKLQTMVANGSY